MSIALASDVHVPKSTGAVEFNADPVVVERPADNASTNAVKQPAVEELRIDHLSQDVIVQIPTPGPVTVFHSGFPRTSVEEVAAEKSKKEKKPAKPKKEKKPAKPKKEKTAKMIKETKVVKPPQTPAPKTGKEAEVK